MAKLLSEVTKAAKTQTKAISQSEIRGFERTSAKVDALARSRDAVAKKLADATKALQKVQDEEAKYAAGVRDNITETGNIAGLDSTAAVIQKLTQAGIAARKFQADIATMKKHGVDAALIKQIADAGVEQGGMTAKALATANSAQIKEINAQQAGLLKSATSTGKTVANALYDTGVNSAKGIVKGLQSQEKAITKQMQKIAESMKTAIKRALGIHSPSRELAKLGVFAGQGLAVGVDSTTGTVKKSFTNLASDVVKHVAGLPGPGPLGSSYVTPYGTGGKGLLSAQHKTEVHVHVQGAVVADKVALGKYMTDALHEHKKSLGGRSLNLG
jgi:hypothetical protein